VAEPGEFDARKIHKEGLRSQEKGLRASSELIARRSWLEAGIPAK
jgi:hypothetical protein